MAIRAVIFLLGPMFLMRHTSSEAPSDDVFVARRETMLVPRLFWSNSCLLLAPNASVARKSCYRWYKVQRFPQHFTPVQYEV